ncbi:MAG: cupin domain-containing protein [Leptolyngbya sp. SIO1D8]|nr:cupin domain-containing protein [Leptolyngbya sp. SIO1D8]
MIVDLNQVPQKTGTGYPQPFRDRIKGRIKQKVGDAIGLKNFGVNWVVLEPGGASALRHWHEQQDEFVYVVAGEVTLITNEGETLMTAGMMAGFPAGESNGHHLVNRGTQPATYLEIGDRTTPEKAHYPDDDLQAISENGTWEFRHKTGEKYEKL